MGFVVGSLFHFLLASAFQQERGLSLCVSTAVRTCFLFSFHGVVHLSGIFCFMFLCGFGRRWFGFVPFGT